MLSAKLHHIHRFLCSVNVCGIAHGFEWPKVIIRCYSKHQHESIPPLNWSGMMFTFIRPPFFKGDSRVFKRVFSFREWLSAEYNRCPVSQSIPSSTALNLIRPHSVIVSCYLLDFHLANVPGIRAPNHIHVMCTAQQIQYAFWMKCFVNYS